MSRVINSIFSPCLEWEFSHRYFPRPSNLSISVGLSNRLAGGHLLHQLSEWMQSHPDPSVGMSRKNCRPRPFPSSASFFLSPSLSLLFFLCLFRPFFLVLYFLFPRSRQTLVMVVGGTSVEVAVGKAYDYRAFGRRVLSGFSPSCSSTNSQARSHKRLTSVTLPSITKGYNR